MSETCADGEACDIDGKVDGVCTLGLQGCINVPGLGACTPAGLSGPPTVTPSKTPTGQALAAALHALDRNAGDLVHVDQLLFFFLDEVVERFSDAHAALTGAAAK